MFLGLLCVDIARYSARIPLLRSYSKQDRVKSKTRGH